MKKKKVYEKPQLKVVEIQLSECIAGSMQVNTALKVNEGRRVTTTVEATGNGVSWDSNF